MYLFMDPNKYNHELLSHKNYGTAPHRPHRIWADPELFPSGPSCLRMLISRTGGLRLASSPDPLRGVALPDEYSWVSRMIEICSRNQQYLAQNPYVYLTVRHGTEWEKDDDWHVDGFSMRAPHVPEQNYVWVNEKPTEWWDEPISLSESFDPMIHNIHKSFQRHIERARRQGIDAVKTLDEDSIYRMSPYVIHRRPEGNFPERTFVRISFTPIPIHDINNTPNPILYQTDGGRDGVKGFRDDLL